MLTASEKEPNLLCSEISETERYKIVPVQGWTSTIFTCRGKKMLHVIGMLVCWFRCVGIILQDQYTDNIILQPVAKQHNTKHICYYLL
jgi:hypothetical protein